MEIPSDGSDRRDEVLVRWSTAYRPVHSDRRDAMGHRNRDAHHLALRLDHLDAA